MRKWTTAILTGLLLVLSVVTAEAQEATPEAVFCGDLAEADCDLLRQSAEAMQTLTGATFDFDFRLTFEEDDEEPQTLSVTGAGSFANLPARMGERMAQPAEMFGLMNQFLAEFQGDLSVTIALPPELREELAEESESDVPESVTLELRMVDGIGYINADTLQPLLEHMNRGETPAMFRGWIGVDIAMFLGEILAANPEIMEELTVFGMNSQTASVMGDPTAFKSAISIERSADAEGLAVFTVTLDFAQLASDPAFIELMRSELEAEGREVTEEQLGMGLEVMAQAGQALTFSSTQTIDPATGFVHNMSFNLSFDGSALPHHGDDHDDDDDAGEEIPTLTLTASLSLDDFNSPPAITVPEDATMLPPAVYEQMAQRMFNSMDDFADSLDVPEVDIPSLTDEAPAAGAEATASP